VTRGELAFTVKVDVTNPGQFFSCCGLLELSHRLWQGAAGWFSDSLFSVTTPRYQQDGLVSLLTNLESSDLSGLDESEEEERRQIEAKRRDLSKKKRLRTKPGSELSTTDKALPEELELKDKERLSRLGQKARKGALVIGQPFFLTLDWWRSEDDVVPKTWAGLQEIHKIARAAQATLSKIRAGGESLFDYECVMKTPPEYSDAKNKGPGTVEPFYFDARRFAHSLDAGFSLDVQNAETRAHPAVELLSLIGLQRFRPCTGDIKWTFSYWTWFNPLSAPVAAGVACGAIPLARSNQYQFDLRFRDDQKRYKAFGIGRRLGRLGG
jgi:CRISPR-associated protein Csx14